MAKEDAISFEGTIAEVLPEGRFRVVLDVNQHEVLAYTGGRMRKNRIRTMRGDRVTVEMSPYDLERARLVFRHKATGASASRRAAPGRRR